MDRFRKLFKRKTREPETLRIVALNNPDFNATKKYLGNKIITSKYAAFTFLPLNMFEQFHRFANLYFLILIIFQFIPQISSLNPVTSLLPLIFVLSVTAIKDGVDDLRRHKSDKKVNKRKVTVIRNGKEMEEAWENVVVGDIVYLKKDEAVTADMVVLLTSEPTGFCLIETAELDGETNLKVRQATEVVSKDFQDHVSQIAHYKYEVHCEPPNNNLSKFEGVLHLGPVSTSPDPSQFGKRPLTNDNILLRGCTLRANEWVCGVVIFAGRDTKLMRNAGAKRYKKTSADVFLNRAVIGIFISMLCCCFICTIYHLSWERSIGFSFQIYQPWEEFMPRENIPAMFTLRAIMIFLSYFILFNTFVPVSLYVSVEIVRLVQSLLITWDKDMWYKETDTAADVRNTSLSEELGQIQYVFSDKTGTLTQNVMTLNKCSIYGVKYGDVLDYATGGTEVDPYEEGANFPPLDLIGQMTPDADPHFLFYDCRLFDAIHYLTASNSPSKNDIMLRHYFRLMALCSTVVPSRVPVPGAKDGSTTLSYQAQSPDENALLSAARSFGYVLHERDAGSLTIAEPGPERSVRTLKFPLLHLLDFDNVRKRMSVIVRDPDDPETIIIYCKGADSSLFPLAAPNQQELIERTTSHLMEFATQGLRTLLFGMRILRRDEFGAWKKRCDEASAAVGDREEKVRKVYSEIEKDFTIVGASAIEDKLQDGVPLAIKQLLCAGIRMWVLTGDKQETAINIGYSCNLLSADTKLTVINDDHAAVPGKVAAMLAQLHVEMEGKAYTPPNRLGNRRNMTRIQRFRSTLSTILASISSLFSGIITKQSKDQQNGAETTEPMFALSITGTALDSILPHLNKKEVNNNNNNNNNNTGHSTTTVNTSTIASTGTLDSADESPEAIAAKNLMDLFVKVAGRCSTVICCRMTPLAKARVVELFRRHLRARTCSIGDGANDVPMIRSANIGVGIAGREGLQAVMASDFAIGQFRFLAKLLLVHGRWSYVRMAKFVLYFLYKNLTMTLAHFFFAFYCGGTAQATFTVILPVNAPSFFAMFWFIQQTAYDPLFVGLFNTIYTAVPCVIIGGSDQEISANELMNFPQLYEVGLNGRILNLKLLILTFLDSIFSAACVFFIHYGTASYMSGSSLAAVELADLRVVSFTLGLTTLTLVTLRCAMITNYWTFWNHFSLWGSLLIFWIAMFVFGPIFSSLFSTTYDYEGAQYMALTWPPTWLASITAIILATLPNILFDSMIRCLKPTLSDAVREQENNSRPYFFVRFYNWIRNLRKKPASEQTPQPTMAPSAPGAIEMNASITVGSLRSSLRSIKSTGSTKRRARLPGDAVPDSGTGYAYSHTEGFGDLLTGRKSGTIPPIYSTHL